MASRVFKPPINLAVRLMDNVELYNRWCTYISKDIRKDPSGAGTELHPNFAKHGEDINAAVCLFLDSIRGRFLDDMEDQKAEESFDELDLDAFIAVEATAVQAFLSKRNTDMGVFTPEGRFHPETLSDWKDGVDEDEIQKEWSRRFEESTLVASMGISTYEAKNRAEMQERAAREKAAAQAAVRLGL